MKLRLAEPRHRGRPRDARVDEAIATAARELFAERGYQAVTITEIARRAGVGTPAIYRRWHDKAALCIDVLSEALSEDRIPDTLAIRDYLVAYVRSRIKSWREPLFHHMLVPLMTEGITRDNVRRRIAEQYLHDMQPMVSRIERAIAEGELAPIDPDLLLDVLGGRIALPLLFNQPLPEESDAEAIVDAVLRGVAADKPSERP